MTNKKNKKRKTTKKIDLSYIKDKALDIKEKGLEYLKTLTVKNYLNILLFLFIFIFATWLFYKYKVHYFPDSKHYYMMAKIILGKLPMSDWQLVRGFGFPLLAASWIKVFGDNPNGVLTGLYIFYMAFMIMFGYLLQKYMKKNDIKNKFLYIFLYIFFVITNPIIFGYCHTFLTESVMPTIYLLTVILCYKWYRSSYKDDKKKTIILNVAFALLGVLVWFIKQPFAPAYFMALLVSAVLSGIYHSSFKAFGKKMITVGICLVTLVASMYSWNSFMKSQVKEDVNEVNDAYLSGGIASGLSVYYYTVPKEKYCSKDYINKLDISKNEKNKIKKIMRKDSKNWCDHIELYEIRNKYNHFVTNEIIISEDASIDLLERSAFVVKNLIKHPNYVLRSYYYNYLAIANIQSRTGYHSSLEYSYTGNGENLTNGLVAFSEYPTLGFMSDGLMDNYAEGPNDNGELNGIMYAHSDSCHALYRLLTLFALPIFIYGIIRFIKVKESEYFMVSVLSGMHFMNTWFNVFMGAIIDRYVYPTYPLMLLCLFILIMEKKKKETKKNSKKEK